MEASAEKEGAKISCHGARRFLLKRLLLIPLGAIAFATTLYAQGNPAWTEQVYSLSAYPIVSTTVGFLPSLASFSVAEWLAVFLLLFFLGYVVYYIRKMVVNRGERGMTAYRGVVGAVAMLSVVYFCFTFPGGLNYYRYTFTHYTGYEVEEHGVDELEQLCVSLADGLNETRGQLEDDADVFSLEPGDFERYAHLSVEAVQLLAEQYPVLERPLYSTPKPVILSELMSQAGIAGIFVPFTMESNIKVNEPLVTLPFTMSHELAHLCGFIREDEANFIAYLACKQIDDPLVQYSGLYSAFTRSISALAKVDPEAASKVRAGLSSEVQRDMEQSSRHYARYDGVIADISTSVNDTYLKANNQADGVGGYGRMVDLLLAEQRATAR